MNPPANCPQGQKQSPEKPAATGPAAKSRRALGGFLVRKERWALSWKGRLLAVILCLALLLIWARTICPFLGVTNKSHGNVLIVEGWIPVHVLKQAAAEFQQGNYQRVLVVRSIFDNVPDKYESGRYYGDYVANLLVQDGVPKDKLDTAFCAVSRKDRTYHSALAARQWLADNHVDAGAFDVATLALHARRSRLLYEKAFGGRTRVGIIALEDPTYDPAHWWRYSEGVREVISEGTAYLYARFLFHAPAAADLKPSPAAAP